MNLVAWIVVLDDVYYIDMCLKSIIPFVDGIFILDEGCTDGTIELAKETVGDKVPLHIEYCPTGLSRFDSNYNEPHFRSFAIQRTEEIFRPTWLLQIDADELFTPFFFAKFRELELSGQLNKFMSIRTATERFITPCWRSQAARALSVIDGVPSYDPHCLGGESKVETEFGWTKIDSLYASWQRGDVLPKVWTEKNGERLLGSIQIAYRRELEPKELIYKIYSPVIGTLYSAPDHVFYTKAGEIQAQNLKTGDLVYCSKPELDDQRKEILLGTLMGDTSLNRIPSGKIRFEFAYGEKQRDYLETKCEIFSQFLKAKIRIDANLRGFGGPICKIATLTNPSFEELYELCFREGRTYFSWSWLSKITEIGLAFWFFDDGSLQYYKFGHSVQFCFRNRNQEEKHNLLKMLKINFGIIAKIKEYGQNSYLRIIGKEAEKFLEITDKYCYCSSLLHKTKDKTVKSLPVFKSRRLLVGINVTPMKSRRPKYLYDLEIRETHKYFAQHFLVHNTRLWRSGLGVRYVQNPSVGGFFHCILRPDPQPILSIPGIFHIHLHRSFGPKAFPFFAEGGDQFEETVPFNPERQAAKWVKIQMQEAVYTPYPWPDYVKKKWQLWGEYSGYDWSENKDWAKEF